ncbi:MAG TPA: ACT domain-containing protein [Thermoanaerobaculia bacterium]|nr:ACT domain-containing protein [Thermoanaerobaculia bacterium]
MAGAHTLTLLPGRFAICRLHPEAALPAWAEGGVFCSMTRTNDELSVVCEEAAVPEGITANRGWRMLKLLGPVPFEETGILAALASPLASAELSIFAISTYETDYVLVKEDAVEAALRALRGAGHKVETRQPA